MTDSDELALLRGELADLRSELAALRHRFDDEPDDDDSVAVPATAVTRRNWMKAAAAAAVGGTAVALLPAQRAAAADVVLGSTNTSATPTTINHTGAQEVGLLAQSGEVFSVSDSSVMAALAGWTTRSEHPVGVYGFSAVPSGIGVQGSATSGDGLTYGVVAEHRHAEGTALRAIGGLDFPGTGVSARGFRGVSASGAEAVVGSGTRYGGVFRGSGSPLLVRSTTGTAPHDRTDEHLQGELYHQSVGTSLWWCVDRGFPGTWQKIAGRGTAGAFHPIEPQRVYDSRLPTPSFGKLSAGENRVVSVADSRDLDTGLVTVADIVPSGATAITYNLACSQTEGGGFVTLTPGDAADFGAASINWTAAGLDISNAGVVKLDASRQIKAFCGGVGATHFIVDVTGFYR